MRLPLLAACLTFLLACSSSPAPEAPAVEVGEAPPSAARAAEAPAQASDPRPPASAGPAAPPEKAAPSSRPVAPSAQASDGACIPVMALTMCRTMSNEACAEELAAVSRMEPGAPACIARCARQDGLCVVKCVPGCGG